MSTPRSNDRRDVVSYRTAGARWLQRVKRPLLFTVAGMLPLLVLAGYGWAVRNAPNLIGQQFDGLTAAERLTATHNARLLIVSIGGALVVAVGLLYTARNYRLSHRGQVTDRFTKALERLGSAELYVRIGGVHALEHVMRDSPDHHADVIEVLIAFIRQRTARTRDASAPKEPELDVQTALTAVVRRPRRRQCERQRSDKLINLSDLHLRGAQLAGANLRNAYLARSTLQAADLQDADLTGADLEQSDLSEADLQNATLGDARLAQARLIVANLRGVNLMGADLSYARLSGAYLQHADLSGANLENAHIDEAELQHANLSRAVLPGARLDGAQLQDADLTEANLAYTSLADANLSRAVLRGVHLQGAQLLIDGKYKPARELTVEQLAHAHIDATTQLPVDLAKGLR